jgi:hypothetical protein
MPLAKRRYDTKYQHENRVIQDWGWRIVDFWSFDAAVEYCQDMEQVLHNGSKVVDPHYLEGLDPKEWESLKLIQPGEIAWEPHERRSHDWRACFQDARNRRYSLSVTDPWAREQLNRGQTIPDEALLTISLATPWFPEDESMPELCFKVVAGVISPD